jgi:intein/homing endonuclease
MAAKVKRISKVSKVPEERQAVTEMSVDTAFLRQLRPIIKQEYFKAPFAKVVSKWCLDYWDQYEEAPGRHIEDIYKSKERNDEIDEDTADLVDTFLQSISDEFERSDNRSTEYFARTAEKYFRKRALEIHNEEIKQLTSVGDVDNAESRIAEFRRPARDEGGWVNPFTNEVIIQEAFTHTTKPLFRLPGALGEKLNDLLVREGFLSFMGPEKRGKCLSWDTPVLLSDGRYKIIRDVVRDKDSKILSLNEKEMKFEPRAISDHWVNGLKPCVKITTRTGRTITTTLKHPYLTPSGWKQVKELSPGDYVAAPRKISCFGTKTMPVEKTRLLALMLAEGSMTTTGCPTFTSSHIDIQQEFFECIEFMGDQATQIKDDLISFRIINSKEHKGRHDKNNTRRWLKELGLLEKKSKDKFIPDIVFQLKKKQLSYFLNILFSCDGSIFKGGMEYSSASEIMVRQVHHLLLRFGVVSKISSSEVNSVTYWRISIGDKENQLNFINRIGFSFYKKEIAKISKLRLMAQKRSNSFLDAVPFEICKKIKNQTQKCKLTPNLREYLRAAAKDGLKLSRSAIASVASMTENQEAINAAHGDILWDEIISIEDVGMVETYDLSVPDLHNFIAGDIVAHNTFWLMYLSKRAAAAGLNVAFFAVGDMSARQMVIRYGIMQNRRSNRAKYCGKILVPILDCKHNQTGDCEMHERKGFGDIVKDNEDGKMTMHSFEEESDHIACDYCRKDREHKWEYKGATWWKERESVVPLDWREALKGGLEFSKKSMRKGSFRMSVHANTSINVKGIDAILNTWEAQDGWVPDVILCDYADILAPEDTRKDARGQENDRWKAMRKMSQDWNCLFMTATQANAAAYSTEILSENNFSEDKRKYSHVTGIITLNQKKDDKRSGIMRIGTMFLREDDFDSQQTVTVHQCLAMGQPVLSSYF